MGHTSNSLIRLAVEHHLGLTPTGRPQAGHLKQTLETICDSISSQHFHDWASLSELQREGRLDQLARIHVGRMLDQVLQRSDLLRDLHTEGKIKVIGAMYNVKSGKVDFLDSENDD
jgi:carbonic anhydrase/SulP family sulfate permease